MRLSLKRPRPDQRPKRTRIDVAGLDRARQQARLESSRPRVL